jgi:hypothetical protein
MIGEIMGKKESEDENQLSIAATAKILELENSYLGVMQFERYTEPLRAGGYSYSDSRNILRAPIVLMLVHASRDMPGSIANSEEDEDGELVETAIGTMWYEENTPRSEYGARCKVEIDSRFKSLSKMGVTPEDIRDFWNLAYFDRHHVRLNSLVKFKVAILEAERQLAEQGGNLPLSPEEMAKGSVLTCSAVGSKVLLGPKDELPAEAMSRATSLVASYMSQVDRAEFLQAALSMTLNGLARGLLKA